jgi:glutaredoxin
MQTTPPVITLYGTLWCGAARRARTLLEQHHIPHTWVNIDQEPQAARQVELLTGGFRSVPTLVLPDGSVLIEPSLPDLAKKLGVTLE